MRPPLRLAASACIAHRGRSPLLVGARLWSGAPLLALSLLLLPRGVRAQEGERYTLSGAEAVVYDVAGRVEVGRASGSDVEVWVRRGGDDAARLRVESGTIAGRQTLRVVSPGDEVHYDRGGHGGNTTIRVREDGTFGKGGRRVRIRSRGRGLDAWADVRVLVPAGKRVAVFLGAGEATARDVEGDLLLNVAAAPVTAERIRGALLIDTGSGSVHVSDLDGALSVDTGSGSVEVTGARGKSLKVDTGSGGIRATDLTFEALDLDTGSGSIHALNVSAPKLKLDTGSGGIELDLAGDVEDAVVSTGSGSVRLSIPQSLGARLDVDTGSGGISVDVPFQLTSKDHGELHGTLGDGRGHISIETGSGSVRIGRH